MLLIKLVRELLQTVKLINIYEIKVLRLFSLTLLTFVGQVAQAARRLATGWTARVRSRVSEGVEIFLHSFVSRLVLGSTQPPIK